MLQASGSSNTAGPTNNAVLGNSTTYTSGLTNDNSAFGDRYAQYWNQTIYTVAELNAAGLIAGSNISSITYKTFDLGSSNENYNFSVKIGKTTSTSLLTFQTAGLINVFGPIRYVHVVGDNTIGVWAIPL